jgi:pimeloyl-ACP methyl ester carboxylesterase
MEKSNEKSIAGMDWKDIRKTLKNSNINTRGGNNEDSVERGLRDYFGENLFHTLKDLASQADATREELGNIVLLPGIMGSHLSVGEGDDEKHIWFNLWEIVKGNMKRLKISRGDKNTVGETVRATGLIGWYYALALESLQAEPFPYDWRLDTKDTANKLAEFIEAKLASKEFDENKPINFVAHSMGGLVVRNFIRQHKDLWRDKCERLIMLGTPNSGSFSAVQSLMGKNSLVKYLAAADIFQNKADWYEVINSFMALYQLCPSKSLNPEVYEKTLWANFPNVLFADCLETIPKFHQDLFDDRETTIDKNRMSYIAGIGYETPTDLKTMPNGEYEFGLTLDGDGTVSHALGLLDGVTTYYVQGSPHGSLLNNRKVLEAVKDLVKDGNTQILPTKKPIINRSRAVQAAPVITYELEQVETIANQIRHNQDPEPMLVADSEKILLRALLGGEEKFSDGLELIKIGKPKNVKPLELEVGQAFGDITIVDSPVIVVGQYQNLPAGGAGYAVSQKINDLIGLAYENQMMGLNLGQLFVIPLAHLRQRETAKPEEQLHPNVEMVIVAGMGQYGTFSREDLRYLMMNVTLGVEKLGYNQFATVLIGASIDTFSVERAIRSIWYGISDSVERLGEKKRVDKMTVTLVESNKNRQNLLEETIQKLKVEDADNAQKKNKSKAKNASSQTSTAKKLYDFANLKLSFTDPKILESLNTGNSKTNKKLPVAGNTRITANRTFEKFNEVTNEIESGKLEIAAFTSNAAIPFREMPINDAVLEQLNDALRFTGDTKVQEDYGKLLHSFLIPEDFQGILDSDKSLTLVLNRAASSIPWEMIFFGGVGRLTNFGIDLRLSRQFSSAKTIVPGAAPPLNRQFKALIIADPAPEPELQLAGARWEGVQLREFFRRKQIELKDELDLQFQVRIGHEECNIVQILSLIYNEEFDLVHFAGHGTFDKDSISRSGWVFGKNMILSAHEIFRLRRVPRLVFANACFSAELSTAESSGQLAGLAEAFFNRGIENYIGTGWQVNDQHAIAFAKEFYSKTIEDRLTLGEGLSEARKIVSPLIDKTINPSDTTWAAYQHYGDSDARLVI